MVYSRCRDIIDKWHGQSVLVVGDIILDVTTHVTTGYRNPEDASVPVYRIQDRAFTLGGAANVAVNLHKMGAEVALVGAVGDDSAGQQVRYLMAYEGLDTEYLVGDRWSVGGTTVKERVFSYSGTKPLYRLDNNMVRLSDAAIRELADNLDRVLDGEPRPCQGGMLLSDYSKGVLSPRMVRDVLSSHQVPHSVLDPRRGMLGGDVHVDAVTPNAYESAMLGGPSPDRARFFQVIPGLEAVVETRGAVGAKLILPDGSSTMVGTMPHPVPDVCGAGDTFAAALLLSRMAGASWEDAARIANVAAHAAVSHRGTYAPDAAEVAEVLGYLCSGC